MAKRLSSHAAPAPEFGTRKAEKNINGQKGQTEHHCGLNLLKRATPRHALTHNVRNTYTTVIMVLGVSFFALYLLPNEIYLEYVSIPEQLADTQATTSEIFSTIDFYFP